MKPRRSILSVPGHVEKMHHKACQSAADVIMLDLEDSVPVDAKLSARSRVIQALQTLSWGEKTLVLRINGLDTPFGYRDLLEVVEATGDRLDAVVLPKVNHCGDVYFAARLLDGIEMNKGFARPVAIEASIESAQGLESIAETARCSGRLKSLVFGIADYSASVGARLVSISGHGEQEEDLYPGHRWHFVMSRIVMAAKANGLMAIDAPYGNFRDPAGLRRSAVMSCALGFDGKWAIHPDQIEMINQVFSPSMEDVQRAQKILRAYQQAKDEGRGAVALEGRMVDGATVRLARQLWAQARHLKMVQESSGFSDGAAGRGETHERG